ncbi:MAG: DUF1294 domain-containing protein [Clostridia bacterium]|nr:DUF1294 domain-containing protein [Clostridia bacterium]
MIAFYLIYLLLFSLVTFALYGIDKGRAKRGAWRIPEKVLLGASLLGGAVGGTLGMQLFRHKTKHWYFYAVNILAIVLHVVIALVLLP